MSIDFCISFRCRFWFQGSMPILIGILISISMPTWMSSFSFSVDWHLLLLSMSILISSLNVNLDWHLHFNFDADSDLKIKCQCRLACAFQFRCRFRLQGQMLISIEICLSSPTQFRFQGWVQCRLAFEFEVSLPKRISKWNFNVDEHLYFNFEFDADFRAQCWSRLAFAFTFDANHWRSRHGLENERIQLHPSFFRIIKVTYWHLTSERQ